MYGLHSALLEIGALLKAFNYSKQLQVTSFLNASSALWHSSYSIFSYITPFPLLAQEASNTVELTISSGEEWKQEKFDALFAEAEKLWEEGELEKAAGLYEQLLAWNEGSHGSNNKNTAVILADLGGVYRDLLGIKNRRKYHDVRWLLRSDFLVLMICGQAFHLFS